MRMWIRLLISNSGVEVPMAAVVSIAPTSIDSVLEMGSRLAILLQHAQLEATSDQISEAILARVALDGRQFLTRGRGKFRRAAQNLKLLVIVLDASLSP
jgi:hypothetical protein